MSLSQKQLQDVCLLHQQGQCRYLDFDPQTGNMNCIKKRPLEKAKIDQRVIVVLDDLRKRGIDPNQHNIPTGDNCAGYPLLKNITQGYDQP